MCNYNSMTIYQKLSKIQQEFKSKKSRYNSFGKYYFRSAEDILEATKPFLKELDVSVTIKEELISFDPPVMQVTARLNNGKEETGTGNIKTVSAIAVVGVDLDQKVCKCHKDMAQQVLTVRNMR